MKSIDTPTRKQALAVGGQAWREMKSDINAQVVAARPDYVWVAAYGEYARADDSGYVHCNEDRMKLNAAVDAENELIARGLRKNFISHSPTFQGWR